MNPILSIVYVYYNTPYEIKKSIESLKRTLQTKSYEIIIIDNASLKNLPQDIYKLSNINIIRNKKNYGYGKGLNQGCRIAKGKYLLLVNPDVEFTEDSIRYLLDRIENDSKIGIVAPQLINEEKEVIQSISGMPYLPGALFIFSFISKIWPNNPFSSKYHNAGLDRNQEQNVDVVGGACLMVRKFLFDAVGGFDERFFMYFEEADFCFRIKKIDYKILYLPKAKVTHLIGRSTRDKEWIKKTFEQSRFKFFKKYHGLIPAILAESLLRFLRFNNILLLFILMLSVFVNFYEINNRMIFIGDQGWFYISARDMLINGQIPLVGIASSHPWLHQGPLWTYILAFLFWIFNYNPLSGGYFSAILGVITVFYIYKVGKEMFSEKIGLISALLYATSPLVVVTSQMPYHTSPIPLFTLLFIFSSYKFIKGNSKFFPLSVLFLSILYNLELATVVLWFILLIILTYGVWKKTEWIKKIFNKRILICSILAFLIPMVPIIIYDFNNNFPQTLKFIAWIGYRVLSFFGIINVHEERFLLISGSMFTFSFHYYQNLIFAKSNVVSFILLIFSLLILFFNILNFFRKKTYETGQMFLALWIIIPLAGYFINKIPSGAYLPIFFPAFIYLLAFSFDKIMKTKALFIISALLILFIVLMNIHFITFSKDSISKSDFSKRIAIAEKIVNEADGRPYNIIGRGDGSQFESFTMNYEYLAWWLGHPPSKSPQKLKYIIQENKNGIFLIKNE